MLGYRFLELITDVAVVEGGSPGRKTPLWHPTALYGDLSIPGTTHLLRSGESVLLRANLVAKPDLVAPALKPGARVLEAGVITYRVAVCCSNGRLGDYGTTLASAESAAVKIEFLPPE